MAGLLTRLAISLLTCVPVVAFDKTQVQWQVDKVVHHSVNVSTQ